MSSVSTLLFVDVDGVLNVGIADASGAPLALDAGNVTFARKMSKRLDRFSESDRAIAERTIATCDRKVGHGEDCTYEKFALDKLTGVSDVLIERLAMIISAMNGRGAVILASSWRSPKYAARVAKLEAAIGITLQHLQRALQFLKKHRSRKCMQMPKANAHYANPAWDHGASPLYPWTCHFDTNQAAWTQCGQPITPCMMPITTVGGC